MIALLRTPGSPAPRACPSPWEQVCYSRSSAHAPSTVVLKPHTPTSAVVGPGVGFRRRGDEGNMGIRMSWRGIASLNKGRPSRTAPAPPDALSASRTRYALPRTRGAKLTRTAVVPHHEDFHPSRRDRRFAAAAKAFVEILDGSSQTSFGPFDHSQAVRPAGGIQRRAQTILPVRGGGIQQRRGVSWSRLVTRGKR
jgi:hypothetical protein